MITASAPGKVVLSGEYAVLAGAPALVTAVDRRVKVDIDIVDDDQWRFSSAGYSASAVHSITELTGVESLAPEDAAAICQQVLRALIDMNVDLSGLPRGLTIAIDSRPLYHGKHKLGLGSSAAVTVALTQALLALTKGGAEPFTAMLTAHRAAQGGRGSGLDVATAFHGGLIRFKRGDGNPQVDAASLSADLHYRFIWSGSSASTPAFLERFDEWRGDGRPESLTALCQAAEAVAESAPNAARFMRQLRAYTDRLATLDAAAGLGIFGGAHAAAMDAVNPDVVYKPCGAGGGDLGVVFSTDSAALANFVAEVEDLGLEAVALRKDDHGIRISEQ